MKMGNHDDSERPLISMQLQEAKLCLYGHSTVVVVMVVVVAGMIVVISIAVAIAMLCCITVGWLAGKV